MSRTKSKKLWTKEYFIPYRKTSDGFREYVKDRAQQDHKVGTLASRYIPNGAWISNHANGSRAVAFTTPDEARVFKKFYVEISGIERLVVQEEAWF